MSSNLEQMNPSDKSKTPMPVPINMTPHLLPSTNQQPRFCSPVPVSIAPHPYQFAFSSGQAAQMGLLSNVQSPQFVHMGYPNLLSTSSLPLVRQSSIGVQNPMPVNVGSQPSASKKRPAQKQASTKVQNFMGTNQGSTKAQRESFESVRSKLRESFVASLSIVPDQQNKTEATEKNSPIGDVSTIPQAEAGAGSAKLASATSNPSSACRNSAEALNSNEESTKDGASQDVPSIAGSNENTSDQTEARTPDMQEDPITFASLENETPFSRNDELLQGHGLCWASEVDAGTSETITDKVLKRPKLVHEEVTEKPKSLDEELTCYLKEATVQNVESLAITVEAELFKLFGGVNKKYKEKARSLLFNLKDRSNPELRERVLSGDIAPDRLCSMTAEELASKELSEWRIAKAEELAQMVVLLDQEVDIRRLVRKTHKGEIQLEIEQDDSVSVEVAVGGSMLSSIPAKANGIQTQSKSEESEVRPIPNETKASDGPQLAEKGDSLDQNDSNNLDTLLSEDLMVDELKDNELLPPIVSLDEFMQALDSEPPFDDLSMGANLAESNTDNLNSDANPESDSVEHKPEPASELDSSEDISSSKLPLPAASSKDPEELVVNNPSKVDAISKPDSDVKSISVRVEAGTWLPGTRSRSDQIWEGLLQLNVSALATVICFFRSGEKTSTQEWPNYLEIKGRVRLDAFEKFLQELRLSRSRAIMISQFCWKEGSHDSGHMSICETINSYIADQRVGFAEPSPGVELYFCPCNSKTIEMLENHLPKDHTDPLHSTAKNSLIGVVVWRRPHLTTISPRVSSHHKKKHSSSRKQQQNSIKTFDEDIDDVPPGFGPNSNYTNTNNNKFKDDDDLPEFNFVSSNKSHAHMLRAPPARPVEQMRKLIEKYGNSGSSSNKFDDNDIPEWKPNPNPNPNPSFNQPQQQVPPPPQLQLPPLPLQPQQHLMNQNQAPAPPLQLPPLPLAMPQLEFMQQGQQNMNMNMHMDMNMNPMWQQGALQWPLLPSGPPMQQPCNLNYNGQIMVAMGSSCFMGRLVLYQGKCRIGDLDILM